MEVWKIIFLSKWVICRFHVNLPGCTMRAPTRYRSIRSGYNSIYQEAPEKDDERRERLSYDYFYDQNSFPGLLL